MGQARWQIDEGTWEPRPLLSHSLSSTAHNNRRHAATRRARADSGDRALEAPPLQLHPHALTHSGVAAPAPHRLRRGGAAVPAARRTMLSTLEPRSGPSNICFLRTI